MRKGVLYIGMALLILYPPPFCEAQEGEVYRRGVYWLVRSAPKPLVTGIDMEELARRHVPYPLLWKKLWWTREMRYMFGPPLLSVHIGIYPSVRQAEEMALFKICSASWGYGRGPQDLGDNSWWVVTGQGSVEGVVFVRRNVVISVDTEELARAIDRDIVEGAPYVSIGDTFFPPVIRNVTISSSSVNAGEWIEIKVDAYDPHGWQLVDYQVRRKFRAPTEPVSPFVKLELMTHWTNYGYTGQERYLPWYYIVVEKGTSPLRETLIYNVFVANEKNVISEIVWTPEITVFFEEAAEVSVPEMKETPQRLTLLQNHPNPFNSSTLISYTLPEPARVRLQVYNLLGQQVATLAEGYQQAGSYQVRWDGKDKYGHPVPSGVYLYRLQAGELKQTRRMTVLR